MNHSNKAILAVLPSVGWVGCLLLFPDWANAPACFWLTVGLIAANWVICIRELLRRRTILKSLNLVQIPLFCLLSFQLYCAFGAEHYKLDDPLQFRDWVALTGIHCLRAVDILDAQQE